MTVWKKCSDHTTLLCEWRGASKEGAKSCCIDVLLCRKGCGTDVVVWFRAAYRMQRGCASTVLLFCRVPQSLPGLKEGWLHVNMVRIAKNTCKERGKALLKPQKEEVCRSQLFPDLFSAFAIQNPGNRARLGKELCLHWIWQNKMTGDKDKRKPVFVLHFLTSEKIQYLDTQKVRVCLGLSLKHCLREGWTRRIINTSACCFGLRAVLHIIRVWQHEFSQIVRMQVLPLVWNRLICWSWFNLLGDLFGDGLTRKKCEGAQLVLHVLVIYYPWLHTHIHRPTYLSE